MLSMTGYGQARREADGRIMTAEVRAYIYALLKEKGYPKTAEAYWTYKKEK